MTVQCELSATLMTLLCCSHISSLVFELLSLIVALLKPPKSYLLDLYVSWAADSFMSEIDQSILMHFVTLFSPFIIKEWLFALG